MFQSARQIWVWLNLRRLPTGQRLRPGRFQSARQIWVWLNRIQHGAGDACGLFQSARQIWVWLNNWTITGLASGDVFQSARQIWVWLNDARPARRTQGRSVSICQADLGLAEPHPPGLLVHRRTVSICQADLGLAELHWQRSLLSVVGKGGKRRAIPLNRFQSARQIWVWLNMEITTEGPTARKFQSARQIWVWLNGCRWMPALFFFFCFNLPGRFGFG